MSAIIIYAVIGVVMGLAGGLVGIGGSIVMIPALVMAFGLGENNHNQHLYQASAMICNVFVAAGSVFAHHRARLLMPKTLAYLIPASVIACIAGVMVSNISFFSGSRSIWLTRMFGIFLIYTIIDQYIRMRNSSHADNGIDCENFRDSAFGAAGAGVLTGFIGGILGIGGGSICTPFQQLFLNMPIKRAIANSAATIVIGSAAGAIMKNATIHLHGFTVLDSVKIAVSVAPSAIIASFIGARLMHVLPHKAVQAVFIIVLLISAYKLLTA